MSSGSTDAEGLGLTFVETFFKRAAVGGLCPLTVQFTRVLIPCKFQQKKFLLRQSVFSPHHIPLYLHSHPFFSLNKLNLKTNNNHFDDFQTKASREKNGAGQNGRGAVIMINPDISFLPTLSSLPPSPFLSFFLSPFLPSFLSFSLSSSFLSFLNSHL